MNASFRFPRPCVRGLARGSVFGLVAAAVLAGSALTPANADAEVNLYSYRQPFLIEPMLEAFTKETGIKVNTVFAEKGMLEKIRAAGENNPADAVLTVDIGRLDELAQAGVLQSVESDVLNENVPADMRHPDGLWFGLTQRARIALVSNERVPEGAIKTYADLADPKWKGKVCLRTGKHPYNVALIASVIAHKGEDGARAWLAGLRDNLARKPQGSDRAQAKAIHQGECDIGITNTYYVGKMATNEKEPEQKDWAKAVRVEFLQHDGGATHVNISGAAVTKTAKNRENAVKLLEFLSSDEAQRMYASTNFEYPVKPGVEIDPMVASWGTLTPDSLNLEEIARLREKATRLVDEVQFDQGPSS